MSANVGRLYFRKCNSNKMKSCQTNNTEFQTEASTDIYLSFLNFKTLDVMDMYAFIQDVTNFSCQ